MYLFPGPSIKYVPNLEHFPSQNPVCLLEVLHTHWGQLFTNLRVAVVNQGKPAVSGPAGYIFLAFSETVVKWKKQRI